MINPPPQPFESDWELDADSSRDTIQLLVEEVARLEAELHARESASLTISPADTWPDPDAEERIDFEARRRVEQLTGELASRDEMVSLLIEQSRLYEEAAAAQKAEWEQLHHWVDEVERRVEGRDASDERLRVDLDVERARGEAVRRSVESDRRIWDAQRQALENEVDGLRHQLSRSQFQAQPEDETAFLALTTENRKLRTTVAGLERAAAEVDGLRRELDEGRARLDELVNELHKQADDRERERIEHKAECAVLRSEIARRSLEAQADGEAAAVVPQPVAVNSALDADERIRAFRQHLRELHDHEAEQQRTKQTLSSRLSRLWRHTGPN